MLGVRSAHLLRVHDTGAGRASLPGAFRQAAGDPQGDQAGPARRHRRRQPADEHRHADADRDQRRGLPRRARPSEPATPRTTAPARRSTTHRRAGRPSARSSASPGRLVAASEPRRSCTTARFHLAVNMWGLYFAGTLLEQVIGRWRFAPALFRLGHRRLGRSAAGYVLLARPWAHPERSSAYLGASASCWSGSGTSPTGGQVAR